MESKLSGREEHKLQIEQSIQKKIGGYPEIIREYYYGIGNKYSSATKRTYLQKLLQFLDWYKDEKHCDELTQEVICQVQVTDIDKYFVMRKTAGIDSDRVKDCTLSNQFTAIDIFYQFLETRRYIEESPLRLSSNRPSVRKENHSVCLSKEEINSILQAIDEGTGSKTAKGFQKTYRNRDKLLFLLPLTTGIRVSALSEIDIDKIDFSKREFSVIEKEEKFRTFDLAEYVFEVLRDWMDDRQKLLDGKEDVNALFISCRNGVPHRLTVRGIQKVISKYSSVASVKVSPHVLRKTYGTQYYRISKGDIRATAAALGHNNVATTQLYIARDMEKEKEINKEVANYVLDKNCKND